MSFNQDDVVDLDAFNDDALERGAPGAFVSYPPPQTAAPPPRIPTPIPPPFNEEITERMQSGFHPTIGYYPIPSAQAPRPFPVPPNSSRASTPVFNGRPLRHQMQLLLLLHQTQLHLLLYHHDLGAEHEAEYVEEEEVEVVEGHKNNKLKESNQKNLSNLEEKDKIEI